MPTTFKRPDPSTDERAGLTPGLKTCTNPDCPCKNPQPLSEFNTMRQAKDGKQPRCKTCKAAYRVANKERHRAWSKEFRTLNRERLTAENRAQYAANPERTLSRNRLWARNNPEKIKAANRRYARENREKIQEYKRAYHEKHRQRIAAAGRERYLNNRDARIEAARQWREANPERRAAIASNYKARKKGAIGTHNANDVAAKFELQGGECYYCFANLKTTGFHIEHKIPLARGGTNWPANICCACPTCNGRKKDKPFFQFISQLGTMLYER